MTPKKYKTRLFSLLDKLEQDLPAHERKAIADEIRGMIDALIPEE